ncbi:MAG: MBL fold metallo-hydrolase [Acidimicrobiales bacterium]
MEVSVPAPAGASGNPLLIAGQAVAIQAGVARVVAPNPGIMTGPGTNTYIVGDRQVALIDPGPDDDAHFATLCAAVGDRLCWIMVTHTHLDHSPLANRLRAATGAEVLGFGPAPLRHRGGLDGHDLAFSPDRRLRHGDAVASREFRLEVLHTPGHASNHLCFELSGTGLLFSGDHVMSGSTVVIGPPDGDMARYLESLELLRRRVPRRIAPGHGGVIDDPAAVLDGYLLHRRQRESQILAGLAAAGPQTGAGPGVTAAQLVARIYLDVPTLLHPVARHSVWAHLRKLESEGRALSAEPDDITAPWWPAPPSSPAGTGSQK